MAVDTGSSPRTWGTELQAGCVCAQNRFIPTHVGNSAQKVDQEGARAVHPHARGEQLLMSIAWRPVRGSSPRTWGTGPQRLARQQGLTVHPHARGEQNFEQALTFSKYGSSPRTWGTGAGPVLPFCGWRFIPTHVGNSGKCPKREAPKTVHPHARGEQHQRLCAVADCDGSSPRTWGTAEILQQGQPRHRFIPTHVGNSPTRHPRHRRSAVHPHARGEQDGTADPVVL